VRIRASAALAPVFLALATASEAEPARPARSEPTPGILGFSAAAAQRQRQVEARLRAIPDPRSIRRWHEEFTSAPHPAGSARNRELAELIADEWRRQGLEDVLIRRYDVLSSQPREVRVEMVAPVRYAPSLREDLIPEDPTSSHPALSGGWLSFSASGEVTAPAVYANSGNPADYEVLRQHGIDPRGKVVIVRYSNPYSYRGFKALTAEREGAAAMIVYSDPAEDGYAQGKVYPEGPWGPPSHLQRGGIAYDYIVPGDPLTPGWASTERARRIPLEEARSVPKIIGVPMSYRDIRPILEKLGGPMAPKDWQGALPIQYRLGGEAVRLHLKVDMRTEVEPYYNVEGRIVGSERPDEWIILGNHRDAWVFGGVDPSSGTAAMMELTRALGILKGEGIRPRRTLIFCSWDGEEVTLTGSTEWVEQLAPDLRRKAVAYLNVDSAASGSRLDLSAVGSLAPMLREVARDLEDPSGVPLLDAWRRPDGKRQGPKQGRLPLESLVRTRIGSGSDHTAFINFAGVPIIDMTFDGPYGVYHSAYDSHAWVSRIGDPGFKYHDLMVELLGVVALRLANAEILPFDFEPYAAALRDFIREAEAIPGAAGELDMAALAAQARLLRLQARRLGWRMERLLGAGSPSQALADRVNGRILRFERNWIDERGIPGRPWFKHLLYAPRYTYAAMTLPGITEAAEAGDWKRARAEAERVREAIARNADLLENAAADLDGAAAPPGPLEARLRSIRDRFDGRMAIYLENVATGETLGIDADSEYETFSVIKVPIMAEVFRRAERGTLNLSERVTLSAAHRRIPSGVLYALDPGLRPTIRDLVRLMIIVSDNEATDVLADRVGRDAVTRFMADLGLPNTRIRFSDLDWDRTWLGFLDPAYAEADGDRTLSFPFDRFSGRQVSDAFRRVVEETGLYFGRSTARETGRLFSLLARGELVSEKASREMLEILKLQQVDDRFPRYLGDGVVAAHKTGDGQPWVANDAGVLWVRGQPVVLVVFTSHHRGTTDEMHEAIARVAAEVVDHFGGEVDPAGLD
jgi:N-acetylated-alpha-linked acidic dipeptidase